MVRVGCLISRGRDSDRGSGRVSVSGSDSKQRRGPARARHPDTATGRGVGHGPRRNGKPAAATGSATAAAAANSAEPGAVTAPGHGPRTRGRTRTRPHPRTSPPCHPERACESRGPLRAWSGRRCNEGAFVAGGLFRRQRQGQWQQTPVSRLSSHTPAARESRPLRSTRRRAPAGVPATSDARDTKDGCRASAGRPAGEGGAILFQRCPAPARAKRRSA
jgi:hypothetical protein